MPAPGSAGGVCTDFFTAVNKDWIERTTLPVDPSDTVQTLGVKYDTIHVDNYALVARDVQRTMLQILTEARAAAPTTKDPVTRVLGTFYNSCMVTPPSDSTTRVKATDGGGSRCVAETDQVLGNALGRAYVSRMTTPATIARVQALAEQLRGAMATRIRALPWMSPTTKQHALQKLMTMRFRIGNADKVEDYSQLDLSPTDYTGNLTKVRYLEYQNSMKAMGGSPDTTTMLFRQYEVNAQYIPTVNAIEVPVVLFQEPFFNPNADAVENYAGLAEIMGHEMTHGFDGNGAGYDENGKHDNWWLPDDYTKFTTEYTKLIHQYDAFTVDGQPVNGGKTLNENMADLGGLNLAFDVYMRGIGKSTHGRTAGMTPEQRFFLAFAATERSKSSPNHAKYMLDRDPHAPNRWRVNGVLANMPAFAKAFGCKPGDPMVLPPAARSRIW